MNLLIKKIKQVQSTHIEKQIEVRLIEFRKIGRNKNKIFSELCFCLLTANFQAEKSWNIQKEIEDMFFDANLEDLRIELKARGHRFWPQRAERIILARESRDELIELIKTKNESNIRNWLVKNIKGVGMKESSHFLRNIGFRGVAIIDFHIVDLLVAEGLIEKPKTITPKIYLEIEDVLKNLAKKSNMNLGELDLYLWYIETGKVLK
ncbi:N-glycosylase/DNA lyase [archaeon]|jgi:N-glycosylase/DNA lyase|nr:N-glycosylase/DNA lyase [archaeon]